MEVMAFQNDDFGDKLTAIVEEIRLDGTFGTRAINESGLKKLTLDRLGINVDFQIVKDQRLNAAIITPTLNSSHPFNQFFSGLHNADMGRLIAELGERGDKLGTVDLKNMKVSGIYSKLPHDLFITEGLMRSNLDAKVITAIILHELGHAMTFLYFTNNLTMGSVITSAIVNAAFETNDGKLRESILERGTRILGVDNVQVRGLAQRPKAEAKTLLETLYIDGDVTALRSETGCNIYEAKSCEQLADMMVAKFGYSVPLAVGLDRLFGNSRNNVFTNMIKISLEVITYASFIGILVLPAYLITKDFGALISGYDNPVDRIRYLRKHLIQELKEDNGLPKATLQNILKDIDTVEAIAKKHGPAESITNYLQRRFISPVRAAKRNQDFQKAIEDLLYNDAFVAYAKFKNLT